MQTGWDVDMTDGCYSPFFQVLVWEASWSVHRLYLPRPHDPCVSGKIFWIPYSSANSLLFTTILILLGQITMQVHFHLILKCKN